LFSFKYVKNNSNILNATTLQQFCFEGEMTASGEMHMRTELLGVPVDILNMSETLREVESAIDSRMCLQHVALNVAKLVSLQKNTELKQDVLSANIVGIDGMGIVLALRLLGYRSVPRVAGVDLMYSTLALCAANGYRPYFLGARPEVVNAAVTTANQMYPNLKFAGFQDGYFSDDNENLVMERVRKSGADCLFIGMPSPRKERLMRKWCDKLDVPFIMGVGGSLDILAGKTVRAPQWMQRSGFEWAYRIYEEPGRMWRRYLSTNTKFALLLLRLLATRVWRGKTHVS
jgi:N-acetylglucosaminyldiphosphoundecaprenol N-acetyl-beta-D-mannosaminyltransferase